MMFKPFPTYRQLDSMDCGPTCLRMIAKYYGRAYSIQNLREKAFITREGVSMLGISDPEIKGLFDLSISIQQEGEQEKHPLLSLCRNQINNG